MLAIFNTFVPPPELTSFFLHRTDLRPHLYPPFHKSSKSPSLLSDTEAKVLNIFILIRIGYQCRGFELLDDNEGGSRCST